MKAPEASKAWKAMKAMKKKQATAPEKMPPSASLAVTKPRCFPCGTETTNRLYCPDKLCPHIACSLTCLFPMYEEWLDIKKELLEGEMLGQSVRRTNP